MSNVNTLKAIQCLIGSNCIVSTPDAFYVGPKGLISTAEIVQTLDEHNNKINNNTSNINAIQADLNGIDNDVNSIKAVLSNINNDIQLLKDTDDAIYETFNEQSEYISANTQNIEQQQNQINYIHNLLPQVISLIPGTTIYIPDTQYGQFMVQYVDGDDIRLLGYLYKFKNQASTMGVVSILTDGSLEERTDQLGQNNYEYRSGQWIQV